MHVAIDRVDKAYPQQRVLSSASLDIAGGQVVAVVGINGAGKSTLLRCLAGLVIPDRGEIRFDGEKFSRRRLDLRRRLHFLSEVPTILPHADLLRHLGLVLAAYDVDDPQVGERASSLLSELRLTNCAHRHSETLSRGQLYKAGLLPMLILDRELWLCDEPFASGMDSLGMKAFKRHAQSAAERGHTVVYSTQVLEVAESFSDQVCILHDAKVLYFGPVQDIQRTMVSSRTLEDVFELFCETPPQP
jgi:ABC-2 type transport system ATP-binding protein